MFGFRWLKIPPIPGITRNELSRVEDRLTSILSLFVLAVLFHLLDTRLNQWIINAIVMLDILMRGWHHQNQLGVYMMGNGIMELASNMWTVWSLIMWQVIPPQMRLTMHFGIAIYAINTMILTSIGEYLEEDGPAYDLYACVPAHRDGLVTFFLTTYMLKNNFCWNAASYIVSSKVAMSVIMGVVAGLGLSALFRSLIVLGILAVIRPILLRTEVIWDICDALEGEWYRWKRESEISKNDWEWSYNIHECTTNYEYKPLRPGEIRILEMYRAEGGAAEWWKIPGTIQARMRHVKLAYPGVYEAVSYHWAESTGTKTIMVDGARFAITSSAYEVLRARRSMQDSRSIWIDAICIDQSNTEEKSTQIQLMRDIYRKAKRVIAFPCSDPIVRLTAPLLFQIAEDTPAYNHHDSWLQFRPIFALQRLSPRWRAMATLLNTEYFRRAWVIQELAVGNDVQFYLGGLYLSVDDLFKAIGHFQHLPRSVLLLATCEGGDPMLSHLSENVMMLVQLRPNDDVRYDYSKPYEERTTLSATIMNTTRFRASDPRDLVYAKLGVATDLTDSSLIRPDYAKPVAEVFVDTARYLLVHSSKPSLHILSLAGAGFGSRNPLLPSWVPDLNQTLARCRFTAVGHALAKTPFSSTSGTFQASGNVALVAKEHDGRLTLRGVQCEQILAVSATSVGTDAGPNDGIPKSAQELAVLAKSRRESVLGLQDLLRSHRDMFSDNNSFDERVGRLLIAFSPRNPSPATTHGVLYRSWIEDLHAVVANPLEAIRSNTSMRTGAAGVTFQETEGVQYAGAIAAACLGRRFAITKHGRLCLVPPLTLSGDVVFVPFGAETPYICRPLPSSGEAVLMGDAYVEGLMMGEALEQGMQPCVTDICLR